VVALIWGFVKFVVKSALVAFFLGLFSLIVLGILFR